MLITIKGSHHIAINLRIQNYPKTKKLASTGENVHFFVFGVLQNVGLMGI